jgi:hypothetical protein
VLSLCKNQIPEQTLATQAPNQRSQSQRPIKNENKRESTPEPSRVQRPIKRSSNENEDTPQPSQSQKLIKNEDKNEAPEPSRVQKAIKIETKHENTPEPSRIRKSIKPGSSKIEDTPSPFALANHSIRSTKPKPKLELELAPPPRSSMTTTHTPVLDPPPKESLKKEPADQTPNKPSLIKSTTTTTKSFIPKRDVTTKRAFVDLTNDSSSDEDDTPSKKPRIR